MSESDLFEAIYSVPMSYSLFCWLLLFVVLLVIVIRCFACYCLVRMGFVLIAFLLNYAIDISFIVIVSSQFMCLIILFINKNNNRMMYGCLVFYLRHNSIYYTGFCDSLLICQQITQIPHMSDEILGSSMCLLVRVVMSSSGKTAFGQVSKLMNVTTMKLMRIETNNSKLKESWRKFILLMHGYPSFDSRLIILMQNTKG